MKIFLLIYMISTHAGQQPTVEKLEQPDMATCQAQAKETHRQLDVKECGFGCQPAYIVRTNCVTAVN